MACLRRSCFSRHLCSGFYRRLLKGYHRCLIMRPHQETPWMQKCKVYACIQSCPIFALEVPSWSSSVLAEIMTQVPQRYPGCRVVYPSSLLLLIAWVSSSRVVSLKFSLLRVQAKILQHCFLFEKCWCIGRWSITYAVLTLKVVE
jgi:hypothetical protein